MKKLLLFKKFFIVLLLAGLSVAGWSQVLYEDFNYSVPGDIGGNTIASGTSNNNWTTHSNSKVGTIDVQTGSLSYIGLAASTGNMIYIPGNNTTTPRDVNRAFIPSGSPTVMYYSTLVNILDNTQPSVAGDYFMSFGAAAGTSVTVLGGRLGAKSANAGANFRFVVQNQSTGTPTYTDNGTDLNFATTYLVVVKYDISTSPTTVTLWVNPTSFGGAEPTGGVSNNSGTGAFSAFASICIRNSATTPKANIDEIRVGETWASVTPAGVVTPTITVISPVTGYQWPQGTSHDISWTATGTNTDVMIEYSANASDVTPTWVTLNASVPASAGVWSSWDIPADQALSADSKIRITDIPQTATGHSGIFSIIAAPAPVATFNPLAAATGIDIASNITVTFDVPVRNLDDSEITDANVASLLTLTTTDVLGTAVPFTATIDAAKKVITINPDADLLNEQLYFVAIAPVEGLSDNATVALNSTFTTAASLAPAISDITITGTLPYHAGDLVTINWISKNVTDVKIEAWVPSENAWTEMFASTPSDGSETFTIPVDAQYSTDYKIRVTDVANTGVSAESAIFTVIAAIRDVTITEVAPYYAGDVVTITWASSNVTDVMIETWLPTQGIWTRIFDTTPSDGSETFTIPSDAEYSTDYKIRVTDATIPAGPSAESSNFTIIAVANDLVTLRAQPVNSIVKYTGIATVTFAQTTRNQKYIQDATAAVLIDDPNPGFIGAYTVGEGITNIVGKILLYHTLIEFTPMAATGEHATGSVIVPEVRTLASLKTADQGKLVKIENFAFKTPNQWDAVTGLFVKSKNYDIDGQDNALMVYRTAFGSVDYIGAPVPVGPISSIGIVGQFDAQMQITARSWADMTVPTVADFDGTPTAILENDTVQFMDMSTNNPVSWEWTFEGGHPATSTDQSPFISYAAKGNYAVTLKVTNASGGTNTIIKTDYIQVGVLGISSLESAVSVYPNPTSDNLYISNPSNEKLEITILSTLGQPVKSMQSNQGVTSVNLSGLPKGIYMVKMLNKTSKKTQMQKVVVK